MLPHVKILHDRHSFYDVGGGAQEKDVNKSTKVCVHRMRRLGVCWCKYGQQ